MQSIPKAYLQSPAELIRTLAASGWSQESIAVDAGTSQTTIHRLLKGQMLVRYDVLVRLRELVLGLEEFSEVC